MAAHLEESVKVTSAQLASQTLAELDKRGWCKRATEDGEGKVCFSGAVYYALRMLSPQEHWDQSGLHTLRAVAVHTAEKLFPERDFYIDRYEIVDEGILTTRCKTIESFNDHPATTEEDVRLVLKHLATAEDDTSSLAV